MHQYNEEIQLKDILNKLLEYKTYLIKKKVRILIASFFFFVLGVFSAFFSEKKYNAELTFVVEEEGNAFGFMSAASNQFGLDLGGKSSSTFTQQNILELLKSRGVVVSTLLQNAKVNSKNDLLIEHYLEINQLKDSWITDENFDGVSFHDQLTYIHDSISGRIWKSIISNELSIEQSNKANIINLSYTSIDEEFSKQFVETLIKEMSKMYTSHQTAQAENTLDFLQNRADSVFNELELAEEEFAKVKDINQRIVKASGRLKELQLMRRVEVLNTMYLEIIKNLELSKLTLLNQTPIINIIDKPILPLKENNPSKLLIGVLAGFLGFFLISCFLICKKLVKDALEA